jgi:hypothetical protein
MSTNQTLRGRPRRVCLVTSRLGTGKSLTFFYNELTHLLPDLGPVRLGEVPLLLVVITPLLLLLLNGSLSQPFLNNQTVLNSYRQRSAPPRILAAGGPIAPSYLSPNAGGGGSFGVSANEYVCTQEGAQINFGDLTPYLTYDWQTRWQVVCIPRREESGPLLAS